MPRTRKPIQSRSAAGIISTGKTSSRFLSLPQDAPVVLPTALPCQRHWDFPAFRLAGASSGSCSCSLQWVLCTRVESCPPVPILTAGSIFTHVPFVAPLRGRASSVRRIAVFLPNPAHSHLCLLPAEGFQVLFSTVLCKFA